MICGGENDSNGCHLVGLSEDVVFALHFMATCLLVGVLLVLAMPVKKLSKMAGDLASYSPNSWWIDIL